jgi:dienelactone hydrolase
MCAAAQDPDRAAAMRVYKTPQAVQDARATRERHTDTVFTMPHFATRTEWEAFAEKLRKRVLLSSGLYPLPERGALNSRVFDRVQLDDYSVEKAHFEAWPGFYVTGNLYRPVGAGPFPAVLMPHGHWEKGRLEDGERGSVPARAITFARMGAIALTIDMVGYNDSCQLEHRWSDPAQKLWGMQPFGIQLWSSIRAVDFLESLPDVDRTRIGCTGASGGGTQTFALTAVDSRIAVSAPVNMISSTMQGGCVCENAPIIRLDNSNMEIGAMMAPRPMLLVSATGDWTRETPRVEYPAIRSVYELYGAAHRVDTVLIDAPHNYNLESREAVYRFFRKWLLDEENPEDFNEPPYMMEPAETLRVFPEGELPKGAVTGEAAMALILDAMKQKRTAMIEEAASNLEEFQHTYRDLFALLTGASTPDVNDLAVERVALDQRGTYAIERWILGRRGVGDRVPTLLYRSEGGQPQDAVIVVHGEGKAALSTELIQGLIESGKAVLAIDAYLLGEHHAPGSQTTQHVIGDFADTFHPTLTGHRVQDILTAVAFLRSRRDMTGAVDVVGLGEAGMWALFASAIDAEIDTTVADMNGFNPTDDAAWVERHYVPSVRGVGDVVTASALIAPRALTLANLHEQFPVDDLLAFYSAGAFRGSSEPLTASGVLAAVR